MSLILASLAFGLVVAFIFVGLIGIIVPLIPGTLLIWITVLLYVLSTDFNPVTPLTFALITLICLVAGTSDYWLSLLGASKSGATPRSLLLGTVGGVVGTFVIPLLGTIIGYAAGILAGEYLQKRHWGQALRASLGGVAGWGLAMAVELGGGLLVLAIVVWQGLVV